MDHVLGGFYTFCRKEQQDRLKRPHAAAARLTSGCTRGSPNDTAFLEAGLKPLSVRGTARAAILREKALRLPTPTGASAVAQENVPKRLHRQALVSKGGYRVRAGEPRLRRHQMNPDSMVCRVNLSLCPQQSRRRQIWASPSSTHAPHPVQEDRSSRRKERGGVRDSCTASTGWGRGLNRWSG